jgi:hypothetical protein
MFEFMDSTLSKVKGHQVKGDVVDDDVFKVRTKEWSKQKMLLHFFTHITYIALTTLLGAMFPFFRDIFEVDATFIVFPFNFGLVHHLYLKETTYRNQNPMTKSPPPHFNISTHQISKSSTKFWYEGCPKVVVKWCIRV